MRPSARFGSWGVSTKRSGFLQSCTYLFGIADELVEGGCSGFDLPTRNANARSFSRCANAVCGGLTFSRLLTSDMIADDLSRIEDDQKSSQSVDTAWSMTRRLRVPRCSSRLAIQGPRPLMNGQVFAAVRMTGPRVPSLRRGWPHGKELFGKTIEPTKLTKGILSAFDILSRAFSSVLRWRVIFQPASESRVLPRHSPFPQHIHRQRAKHPARHRFQRATCFLLRHALRDQPGFKLLRWGIVGHSPCQEPAFDVETVGVRRGVALALAAAPLRDIEGAEKTSADTGWAHGQGPL